MNGWTRVDRGKRQRTKTALREMDRYWRDNAGRDERSLYNDVGWVNRYEDAQDALYDDPAYPFPFERDHDRADRAW